MNLNKKKAAVKRYADFANLTPEEITSNIKTAEPTMSDDEIAEIVAALKEVPEPAAENPNGNKDFEEWRVDPVYKQFEAKKGAQAYTELTGYEKVKLVRNTRISQEKADLMNQHSPESKIRYYLKGAKD